MFQRRKEKAQTKEIPSFDSQLPNLRTRLPEEPPVVPPAEKVLEGQKVLDYLNIEDKPEIRIMLEGFFKDGNTEASKIHEHITNPQSLVRVININEKHIASYLANYTRWNKEIEEKEEPEPEEYEESNPRIDDLEHAVGDINTKIDTIASGFDKVLKKIDKPAQKAAPEIPPVEIASTPELDEFKTMLAERKKDLQIKKSTLETAKETSKVLRELKKYSKQLDDKQTDIETLKNALSGEGDDENIPTIDIEDIQVDAFTLLKELKKVNPRSFRNVLRNTDLKDKTKIKEIMERL